MVIERRKDDKNERIAIWMILLSAVVYIGSHAMVALLN
jgi:hypothetical protein